MRELTYDEGQGHKVEDRHIHLHFLSLQMLLAKATRSERHNQATMQARPMGVKYYPTVLDYQVKVQ